MKFTWRSREVEHVTVSDSPRQSPVTGQWYAPGESMPAWVKRCVMTHVATCDSQLDAAVKLAEYHERWLGPYWGELIETHRRNLWEHAPWKVRYVRQGEGVVRSGSSRVRSGWLLSVWVDGVCKRIGMPQGEDRGDRETNGPWKGEPRLFPSWEDARAHLHPWLEATYGADAHLRMWRPREAESVPGKFPEKRTHCR